MFIRLLKYATAEVPKEWLFTRNCSRVILSPAAVCSPRHIGDHLANFRHREIHHNQDCESDRLEADGRLHQSMVHALMSAHERYQQAGGNHSSGGKELDGRSGVKSVPE